MPNRFCILIHGLWAHYDVSRVSVPPHHVTVCLRTLHLENSGGVAFRWDPILQTAKEVRGRTLSPISAFMELKVMFREQCSICLPRTYRWTERLPYVHIHICGEVRYC